MEAVLNLGALAFTVVIGAIATVLILKSDGKGCDKGGPGCYNCPFPCKYNR